MIKFILFIAILCSAVYGDFVFTEQLRNDGASVLFVTITKSPEKTTRYCWLLPGKTITTGTDSVIYDADGNTVCTGFNWGICIRKLGDIDGDGQVNLADMKLLMKQFGTPGDGSCDFDGDGLVTLSDLKILQDNWNK